MTRTVEDVKKACAVIRAALSNKDCERALLQAGHERQAIADAFSIGQASEIIVAAFVTQYELIKWLIEEKV